MWCYSIEFLGMYKFKLITAHSEKKPVLGLLGSSIAVLGTLEYSYRDAMYWWGIQAWFAERNMINGCFLDESIAEPIINDVVIEQ